MGLLVCYKINEAIVHSIIANNDVPRQIALCEAGKYSFLALAKSVAIWYRRLHRLVLGHGVSPA